MLCTVAHNLRFIMGKTGSAVETSMPTQPLAIIHYRLQAFGRSTTLLGSGTTNLLDCEVFMLSPTTPTPATGSTQHSRTTPPHLVQLKINGVETTLAVEPRRTLLDALRHDLHLTGTKKVCDMGNCGACTVIVDGRAVYACLVRAVDCAGRDITTIEGLLLDEAAASNGDGDGSEILDPVQQAFIDADAFQCGFCTSGQIMSIKALLQSNPTPTDEQIMRAVSGNLCRCGTYRNIIEAGRRAANAQAVKQQFTMK